MVLPMVPSVSAYANFYFLIEKCWLNFQSVISSHETQVGLEKKIYSPPAFLKLPDWSTMQKIFKDIAASHSAVVKHGC